MSTTLRKGGGVLHWWVLIGTPSAKRYTKASKEKTWGELYDAQKEMNRAVAVEKPHEAQKAKALWKMKAAKDAGVEYNDPLREEGIKGRNETGSP